MTAERKTFVVCFNGHWKNGNGRWTYHEQNFDSIDDAYQYYLMATPPKQIDVIYADGFRASLSDRGLEVLLEASKERKMNEKEENE